MMCCTALQLQVFYVCGASRGHLMLKHCCIPHLPSSAEPRVDVELKFWTTASHLVVPHLPRSFIHHEPHQDALTQPVTQTSSPSQNLSRRLICTLLPPDYGIASLSLPSHDLLSTPLNSRDISISELLPILIPIFAVLTDCPLPSTSTLLHIYPVYQLFFSAHTSFIYFSLLGSLVLSISPNLLCCQS